MVNCNSCELTNGPDKFPLLHNLPGDIKHCYPAFCHLSFHCLLSLVCETAANGKSALVFKLVESLFNKQFKALWIINDLFTVKCSGLLALLTLLPHVPKRDLWNTAHSIMFPFRILSVNDICFNSVFLKYFFSP